MLKAPPQRLCARRASCQYGSVRAPQSAQQIYTALSREVFALFV